MIIAIILIDTHFNKFITGNLLASMKHICVSIMVVVVCMHNRMKQWIFIDDAEMWF